ncbi:hypothetical protein HYG81_14985 [Natrinema zhouii]|uniref:Uncharacterized protein n=1 Tax=Natrinema zhouii TaxID=1710539 RepID=A0A7D6CMV6_9EURY|nr:hypothetical protein [Natrinema zhouii]QLK25378.1 hypothetical protein HYG81_14985 [Natrinema zhouii]
MSVYETKTVRVHEPERGQYMYFMLTRFDGEDHILGEIGYMSEYINIALMSQSKGVRVHDTDAYALVSKYPGELHGTIWFEFAYNVEHGGIFDDLEDGDRLSPEDVQELIGEEVTA